VFFPGPRLSLLLQYVCSFLRDLKEGCVSQRPGNKDFWKALCDEGVRMSLISGSEAAQQGGSTNVTDEEAERFLHDV